MPYGVFKTGPDDKPYCVYRVDDEGHKLEDQGTLGCHTSEEGAKEQIQAIGAASHASEKSVGSLIEGCVHESFTRVTDQLYQRDVLTRDERIALSSAIGDSLTSLSKSLDKLGLSTRDLDTLVTETVLNAVKGSEQLDTDISVVAYGSGLKTLGDGRVGGHLVVFSPQGQRRDLVGDYFSRNTLYHWDGKETRPAWYNHGLDKTLGKKDLGTGWHFGQIDDIGMWVETQLNLRDQYEKAIYALARKGKLGLSSGTAEHMIERDEDGRLTRWPIVEGSFTPVPAEPRTLAVPLRSLESVSLKSLMESNLRESGRGRETPRRRGSGPHQKRSARLAVEKVVELLSA